MFGNNHLGHGLPVNDENRGFFSEGNGNKRLVDDMDILKEYVKKEFGNIPYFILGHSMGSFVLRNYIANYDTSDINGVILMGTGNQSAFILNMMKKMSEHISKKNGKKYDSELLRKIVFDTYNKHFAPNKTKFDWLTSDEEEALKYENDELCNFNFTAQGYVDFFKLMMDSSKNIKKIPKDLPIFLISGEDDMVGNCGKSVNAIYKRLLKMGCEDVKIRLYPGLRHCLLLESKKIAVMDDIYEWINERLVK